MPILFTSLFFLTLFFRLASPASAATYYVSRTGSDTNAGIAAAPFATFNKAVSVLNSGDELLIKGGTYNERLVINKNGTAQAPISVRSAPGEKAIIDGQNANNNLLDIPGSHILVSGLEIKNSSGYGTNLVGQNITLENSLVHHTSGHGIYVAGQQVTIRNNSVHDSNLINAGRNAGSWGSGIKVKVGGDGINIIGNIVYHNYGEGIAVTRGKNTRVFGNSVYDNFGVNIYIDNSFDVMVEKNFSFCTPNRSYERDGHAAYAFAIGIEYYDGWGAQLARVTLKNNLTLNCYKGIGFWGSNVPGGGLKDVKIIHNTFWGNLNTAVSIAYSPDTAGSLIAGNIIEQKDQKLAWIENPSGISLHHNFWVGNPPAASTNAGGPGDLSGDVRFAASPAVNPDSFKLSGNSPAIDAIPSGLDVNDDFFASSRPQGSAFDIGAHEYAGNQPVLSPTPASAKPGDANSDAKVDGLDYVIWLQNYNKSATGAGSGDFNVNGFVDGLDYVIWLNNYNK